MVKKWTKEYQDFKHYEKEMCDVILKNGDEVIGCWPNAGFMNPCFKDTDNGYNEIPYEQVDKVRLTHHKKWFRND